MGILDDTSGHQSDRGCWSVAEGHFRRRVSFSCADFFGWADEVYSASLQIAQVNLVEGGKRKLFTVSRVVHPARLLAHVHPLQPMMLFGTCTSLKVVEKTDSRVNSCQKARSLISIQWVAGLAVQVFLVFRYLFSYNARPAMDSFCLDKQCEYSHS